MKPTLPAMPLTPADQAFLAVVRQHARELSYGRMMRLLAHQWAALDPEGAATVGPPRAVAEKDPLHITTEAAVTPEMNPVVRLRWGKTAGELDPMEAACLGVKLLAVAEAAESDAFLWRFFSHTAGPEKAATILGTLLPSFATWRELHRAELAARFTGQERFAPALPEGATDAPAAPVPDDVAERPQDPATAGAVPVGAGDSVPGGPAVPEVPDLPLPGGNHVGLSAEPDARQGDK